MNDDKGPDVLLVEDNPGDITLITEAFEETDVRPEIHCARDGVEALQFLRRQAPFQDAPKPAFVLLDLNLPRKDGRTVLSEIKSDPVLASTPVIILSGSDAPQDISTCYALHANCYIVKPRDLNSLSQTVNFLVGFWLKTVKLPSDLGGRSRGGT
jgi:chemotaxis family two-component system response regulator Rcp1